jgi:hypothetical protein
MALFIVPTIFSFISANAEDESVTAKVVLYSGNERIQGVKSISKNEMEEMEEALNEVTIKLRLLPFLQRLDAVERSVYRLIKAAICLHDLKIFAFLIDWIEGLIDLYITPRTKMSIFPHIFSYGHGRVLIPYYQPLPVGITGLKHETIIGLLLRPIWWHYNTVSYTMVRKEHIFPPRIDFWDMTGRQKGFMIGFMGLYVAFYRPYLPDTHFFVGRTMFLLGEDLIF